MESHRQARRLTHCFNGATTMRSWKSVRYVQLHAPHNMLQWGHDDEVVEEYEDAAMMPSEADLQWGHDDEVVEEIARDDETRL